MRIKCLEHKRNANSVMLSTGRFLQSMKLLGTVNFKRLGLCVLIQRLVGPSPGEVRHCCLFSSKAADPQERDACVAFSFPDNSCLFTTAKECIRFLELDTVI